MVKKGLVHIYTGDGKGKTTAAIGLAVRAAGHQKKVYLIQFLKGSFTGEINILKDIPLITVKRPNKSEKFLFQMTEREKMALKREVRQAWQELGEITRSSSYDVIIIDEIMALIASDLISREEVIELVQKRDKEKELILTGRNAPAELIQLADYVTEMEMIKHPYQQGVSARKGIEF